MLAITCSFVVIFAFFQTKSWNHRTTGNSNESVDLKFIGKFFLFLSSYLSIALFWFHFAISFYLLLFYKTQGVLFVILPTFPSETNLFTMGVMIVFMLQALNLTKRLSDQCKVEIFFLDWEQAKIAPAENLYDHPKQVPVSVWRSIFMSNEWAKLQTFRFCNIEFCLIGVLILLEGLRWKNGGTAKPNLNDLSDGTLNPILLFSMDIICWIIFVIGQVLH